MFATAELAPLARVGGLAEAAAGLVDQLRATAEETGVELDVVLPDYGDVELTDESAIRLHTPVWTRPARARTGLHPVVGEVTLVDVAGMTRPHPYVDEAGAGWDDNDARFLGFSAAVAELVRRRAPDVVHLNDWHTAAVPAFLEPAPPTVLTIHTLGYQGICGAHWLRQLPRHRAAYEWFDQTNPLLGAIRRADAVVAVSPNYAAEILTPDHGAGLHQELAARAHVLHGIRNGIDVGQWNPTADPAIARRYDHTTVDDGKAACRTALLDRVGLRERRDEPVLGVVSRLVDQKGIDLLTDALDTIDLLPGHAVILGSGERHLADRLRALGDRHPDRVAFVDAYDAEIAHAIFAGADLFVMPSRFEPCGLAQMQAMAYGALPVVTDVGGLRDTVVDADRDPEHGTGIVAPHPTGAAVADALWRAVRLWRDEGRRRRAQQIGMTTDWSWAEPGARHVELYRSLLGE